MKFSEMETEIIFSGVCVWGWGGYQIWRAIQWIIQIIKMRNEIAVTEYITFLNMNKQLTICIDFIKYAGLKLKKHRALCHKYLGLTR